MLADAQVRKIIRQMLADTAEMTAPIPMPFERKTDEDGFVLTRGLREYRDDATGQIIYAGALIFVSESRATIARIFEQFGGALPDPPTQ